MADRRDLPERLTAKDPTSFAYVTTKDRLPVILTQVVDYLCQEKNEIAKKYGEESREELKQIIGYLSKLRYEIQTNKQLIMLQTNENDAQIWNEYLSKEMLRLNRPPQWFEDEWLYTENYMYRKIREAFELSDRLNNFDPFCKKKERALWGSMDVIVMTMEYLHHIINNINKNEIKAIKAHFATFLKLSLWSNRCDLSISAGKENVQKDCLIKQLEELNKNILVNDIDKLWEYINKTAQNSNICLDIILDNVGFELICDLCLLEFLTATKLIDKARIYVKMIPWYVSDTMEKDIYWTLNELGQVQNEKVCTLVDRYNKRLKCGEWKIEKEQFWTLPYDFSEMKIVDKALYQKLSDADIILFKGDLNYRKLVGDRKWPTTTPFHIALNNFLPSTLCALRTLKADVVTGLASGQAEKLQNFQSDWMISGEYAVIQCVIK
ncbi:protein-glutamate O-methyltransferase-like [Centruroides sculpturatus]|uniref:protein-glutamate O-methyltransferase-like n=1 Tax=Centruroides sculpturatus TaxID=218467 RepID=UPI000C6E34B3|nr:protein-glutamate O-methyltransferase-like [Centruroides sculpturatus]